MAIGYLIPALLLAWCTGCALWSPRRRGRLGTLAHRFGLLVNELPFVAVYWLVAATLLAFSEGDVGSTSGRLAFGLTLLTLAGLAVVAWRAPQARGALDLALQDGLGPRWRTEIDAALATGLRTRAPVARALLNPFVRRRRDVERIADLSYGDAGRMNLLDVYRHRSRPAGSPVLVHLHGGAFVSGAKNRESLPLLYRLASRGWLCVSANYRLSPAASFPDHLVDVKKVLAWVREHGAEYGADPSVVLVAGDSAGAHLAASAALTQNAPEFQPGFEDADTSVAAAVCLSGYYGTTDATVPASTPAAHIHPDAPPFFVIHGDRDSVAPVDWAREFVSALRGVATRPVVYAELPGAQHTFDLFHSIRCGLAVDRIEAFTAWVRSSR